MKNEFSDREKRVRKKRKKKSLAGRFIKIVVLAVLAFVVLSTSAIFAYSRIVGFDIDDSGSKKASEINFFDALIQRDITLNVALFGVDEDETRTDVIMVAHFDSKSGTTSIMSVPRDTKVDIPDEMYTYLKENNKFIPYGSTCKINEIHVYAGKEQANYFSVLCLEELLGIEIDHYAKVNFQGFIDLVDLFGGLDFYVPRDMYWDMRDNGDILINLKEGMQHLDGAKAQQLVRFRRYALGDVQRAQVQQDFIKALVSKIMSSDDLIKKFPELVRTGYEYVETDISLTDALKYAQYIEDIDIGSLSTETLPGEGKYVGDISYFIHDAVQLKAAVNRVFFSEKATNSGNSDSRDKNIEISNGGNKGGFAGENQQMLLAEGYNIVAVSNFEGEKTNNTRIYVLEENQGQDFIGYYPSAEIIVDKAMLNEGIDILIVLGINE